MDGGDVREAFFCLGIGGFLLGAGAGSGDSASGGLGTLGSGLVGVVVFGPRDVDVLAVALALGPTLFRLGRVGSAWLDRR